MSLMKQEIFVYNNITILLCWIISTLSTVVCLCLSLPILLKLPTCMWAGTRNLPWCRIRLTANCSLGALTKTASANCMPTNQCCCSYCSICNIIKIVYCMLLWLENKLFVFVFEKPPPMQSEAKMELILNVFKDGIFYLLFLGFPIWYSLRHKYI